MGVNDWIIDGTAGEFNKFGDKLFTAADIVSDICTDLEKDLDDMPDYWTGNIATIYKKLLNYKLDKLKLVASSLEDIGSSIKSNSYELEDKLEEINDEKKKNASGTEYVSLLWEDFWDKESF